MPNPVAPELEYLCSAVIELERPPTVIGSKAVFNILGGTIEGPELRGNILRSGGDWLTVRSDGSKALDVRMTIQTDDEQFIFSYYSGRIVCRQASKKWMLRSDILLIQLHTISEQLLYMKHLPKSMRG